MVIREAESGDVDNLLPMAKDLATSFVVDPQAVRESFAACITENKKSIFVAEDRSCLVGYLLGFDRFAFFASGRVSVVEEVYVQPDRRRRGIGTALMRRFEEWAASRDSAQVTACTRRAADFYNALGYEETAICFRMVLK
jgi:GNAT superfamily N-acetyltransferase